MGFAYVIGLHAVQFGNNWMKKFRGQPKYGLVQFACQRNFLKQNKTKKQQQHSQQQEAKSVRRRTAISQQDFFQRIVTRTLR